MSAIDWRARRGADELVCQMVSPADLDEVLGELELADGGSVSQGYYNDTRCAASVSVLDWDRYVPGSWLRLVHQVRGTDYSRELFTGFPSDAPTSLSGVAPSDSATTSVELKSALYAMQLHVYEAPLTVGKGSTARKVLDRICDLDGGRRREFLAGFKDYSYSSTRTFEACQTMTAMCFDVCDAAGDRMDVDAHGVVTFGRYVAPAERTASLLLDATARDTLVIEGSVSRSSTGLSLPNSALVSWKDGESEVVGAASLPSSHARSAAHTGVTRTEVHELQDLPEPRTKAHAQQLAAAYLQADVDSVEWECQTLWWEASEGMVVDFDPGDGSGPRKCLVKNVDSDLTAGAFSHKLTLKEV